MWTPTTYERWATILRVYTPPWFPGRVGMLFNYRVPRRWYPARCRVVVFGSTPVVAPNRETDGKETGSANKSKFTVWWQGRVVRGVPWANGFFFSIKLTFAVHVTFITLEIRRAKRTRDSVGRVNLRTDTSR